MPCSSCVASAASCFSSLRRMPSTRLLRTSRTSTTEASPSATANRPAATSVMRQRTESRRIMRVRSFRAEAVARTAHGADELTVEGLVDLPAEVADVDLDHVRIAGEVHAPHVVEDLALRCHIAVASHEVLEQGELARRELDRLTVTLGATCPRIEAQRSHLEHGRTRRCAAAEQRAQAREQDDERERLRQEVVGAGVEGLGLVPFAVLRGEHEDRRPHALVAELLADLVAVHAR